MNIKDENRELNNAQKQFSERVIWFTSNLSLISGMNSHPIDDTCCGTTVEAMAKNNEWY